MNQLKRYLLQQIDGGKLGGDEALALLREVIESELAAASPARTPRPESTERWSPPAPAGASRVPIAVIGLACRLPGARSLDQLWRGLTAGRDEIRRFPSARLYDVIRTKASLWQQYRARIEDPAYPLLGGWLDGVDDFDHDFFDVRRSDAIVMSPADRMFLETAWSALEHAGQSRRSLLGTRTGIYLAHTPEVPFEYTRLLEVEDPETIPLNNPGATGYRLAYWLDLRGPTMIVNTTCSSSLTATHLACQALAAGDCDLALAGGVSLYLFPFFQDALSDQMGLLAGDGRCKAFDASADGLSMGEGIGVVALKRLDRALADGDPVHAVIRGSAVNSDGHSNGHTAPSPAAQTDCLLRAWQSADIDPRTIGYIETHGAGTKLGDPIEIKAITDAFRQHTSESQFCAIGSIKTNVSHLGDAAGIAGLIKAILCLDHQILPPSLHFHAPNPLIRFAGSPVYVNSKLQQWQARDGVWRAGVSSIGISGTNCHVVLERFDPGQPGAREAAPRARAARLDRQVLSISARTLGSLWRSLEAHAEFLERASDADFTAICYTSLSKDLHAYRTAIIGTSAEDLAFKVRRLSELRHLERLPRRLSSQGVYAARVAGAQSELYSELPAGQDDDCEALVRMLLTPRDADLELARFYPGQPPRKVSLPTYAFDAVRCWPEHEVQPEEQFDSYFFELGWVTQPRPAHDPTPRLDGTWLICDRSDAPASALVARLHAAGARCVQLHPGDGFARAADGVYTVNPAVSQHFVELVRDLTSRGIQRIAGVVHLWGAAPPDDTMESLESLARSQDLACLGAFRLLRALRDAALGQDADYFVVTAHAHAVDDAEPAIIPARITTAGLLKVLTQEVPLASAVHIDIDDIDLDRGDMSEELLAELCVPRRDRRDAIAYRRGVRYVQQLERQGADGGEPRPAAIVDGGVYVIAGGTGYLGLELGKHFARKARVKLVLLSRTPLPPSERRAEARTLAASGSPLASQLDSIAEMEALGSEVLHLPIDVTDRVQVERAFAKIRKRFGKISGVIGAQKHLYHKPIFELGEDEFRLGVANRVQGTWLLDQVTRDDDLDFFIMLSSISSIMGTKTASECCAVNQYLDAYPSARTSRPMATLNLTLILDDQRDFRGPTPIPPLSFREFLGCFDRFLERRSRLAVVARFDPGEVAYLRPVLRIPFSDRLLVDLGVDQPVETARDTVSPAMHLRATASAVAAAEESGPAAMPASPASLEVDGIERQLRMVWHNLLGETPLSREAGFFELGATSLTALKLVRAIRQHWNVGFDAADVFGYPTLRLMAERIAALRGGSTSPGSKNPGQRGRAASPDTGPDRIASVLDGIETGEIDLDTAVAALARNHEG